MQTYRRAAWPLTALGVCPYPPSRRPKSVAAICTISFWLGHSQDEVDVMLDGTDSWVRKANIPTEPCTVPCTEACTPGAPNNTGSRSQTPSPSCDGDRDRCAASHARGRNRSNHANHRHLDGPGTSPPTAPAADTTFRRALVYKVRNPAFEPEM